MDSLNIMFNLPHGKLLEVVFIFCCFVTNCHMSSSLKESARWLAVSISASAWLTGALFRAPGAPVQALTGICLFAPEGSAAGDLLPSSCTLLAKFVVLRLHDLRVLLETA